MKRKGTRDGIGSVRSGNRLLGRLLMAFALAGSLVLPACSSDNGGDGPGAATSVTEPSTPPDSATPEQTPTAPDPDSQAEPYPPDSPDSPDSPEGHSDAAWFAEADDACRLAVDEYGSWKAEAGDNAAPEALALGAAIAATRAAETIEAMPEPTSREALALRVAVIAWASAYRDLAAAMDSSTYSEVTAAGDAAQAAADKIRLAAGSSAASCAVMVDRV
ncbi:hypothetical protein [Humibacillus xanthopallidus]|uniref:hypothetical protein n=1 Tax=Humibacillus xanthopallidus TaxID=412689 RepID=UPI00384ACB4E